MWAMSAPACGPDCSQLGKSPWRCHFQPIQNLSPVYLVGFGHSSGEQTHSGKWWEGWSGKEAVTAHTSAHSYPLPDGNAKEELQSNHTSTCNTGSLVSDHHMLLLKSQGAFASQGLPSQQRVQAP